MKAQTFNMDQYNDPTSTLTLSSADRKGLAKVTGLLPPARLVTPSDAACLLKQISALPGQLGVITLFLNRHRLTEPGCLRAVHEPQGIFCLDMDEKPACLEQMPTGWGCY